jgi:hypothetical protein
MYVLREDFRCTLYGLWEGENRNQDEIFVL